MGFREHHIRHHLRREGPLDLAGLLLRLRATMRIAFRMRRFWRAARAIARQLERMRRRGRVAKDANGVWSLTTCGHEGRQEGCGACLNDVPSRAPMVVLVQASVDVQPDGSARIESWRIVNEQPRPPQRNVFEGAELGGMVLGRGQFLSNDEGEA